MPSRKDILASAQLGSRVAEDETDQLSKYFVETAQWKRLLNDQVDIVFGAKGAGKSALYSLLLKQDQTLRVGRRTVFLPAENPRGTPAFRDLTASPPLAEENFRALWKLYFASIIASYVRHHLNSSRTADPQFEEVARILADAGLVEPHITLLKRLRTAYEYLRSYIPHLEGAVKDPTSGLEFKGKITLGEPTREQSGLGYRSLDELLALLNERLAALKITCWLVLDRLDVAFADTAELEGNALRSLFRTYLDMLGLSNIKLKIFIRDDIWNKVVVQGFREASHVTRTMTLSWDAPSLLNLLVRRLASNVHITDYYATDPEQLLSNAQLQKAFFYKVFPEQVDIGMGKRLTLEWMLSRTSDAKRTAPRELIHLLLESRDEQLRRYDLGNSEPDNDQLIDRLAIRAALPAVSKARYQQTLCPENPSLKPFLDKFEGEKTQQTLESLGRLWKLPRDKCADIAERLVEAGFFEKRGDKGSETYWIPFLYRDALNMVQGAAD